VKIHYLTIGAAFCVFTALAAQVEIPHQFSAGTRANSAEVNANFAALAAESNAQDTRLAAIEGSSRRISAHMICTFPFGIGRPGETPVRCVRDTSPGMPEDSTYSAIVAEGWVAVSTGGEPGQFVTVFHQFETT
jgi:hypothetical protein